MKKNNKKGFTITELLAALAILGILLVIAIPSFSKLKEKFDTQYNAELKNSTIEATKSYYKDNPEARPEKIGDSNKIKVSTLKEKKYIDEKNESNLNDDDCVVTIKTGDKLEYFYCKKNETNNPNECYITDENPETIYLNSNDEVINFESISSIYIHINSYTNDQLKEKLQLNKVVRRKYKKGYEIKYLEYKIDEIFPENITSLVVNKLDESNSSTDLKYQKNVDVFYKINANSSKSRNIILFQHSEPKYNDGTLTYNEPNSFSKTDSFFSKYQYYTNETGWKDITCSNKQPVDNEYKCEIETKLPNKAAFRIVGKNGDITQYGKETNSYDVNTNKTYIIKFDPNGGTGSMSSITCNVGESCILPANEFKRYGYMFSRWSTNDGKNYINAADVKDTPLAVKGKETTLYAQWTSYLIRLNANGGTLGTSSLYVNQSEISPSPIILPTKTYGIRYYYSDYYNSIRNAEGVTVTDKNNNVISSGNTISYNLEFLGWYTNTTDNIQIINNDKEPKFINTNVSGYLSSGKWIGVSDKTLYAHWKDKNYELPTISKPNYVCGWTSSQSGTTIEYQSGQNITITQGMRLYGVCEKDKYKIKFDSNGGTGTMSDQECEIGEQCELNENKFTKLNYEFMGWSLSAGGELKYEDYYDVSNELGIAKKDKVTTLYAVWKNVSTYIIKYIENSGYDQVTDMPNNQIKKHNVDIKITTWYPERIGYYFSTWNTKPDGSGETYGINDLYTKNEDLDLYAIWKERTYTITYDAQGGTECNSQSKKYGEYWDNLCVTKKDDNIFSGWYTSDGRLINEETLVENNLKVYAEWNLVPHTVTFDPNGGTLNGPRTITVTNGDYYSDTGEFETTAEKEHYDFLGWFTEKEGGLEIVPYSTVDLTDDQTLYAHYDTKMYRIELDKQGGTTPEYNKDYIYLEYNSEYNVPNAQKIGHSFIGWSKDINCSTIIDSKDRVDGDRTIYACYQLNTLNVTLEPGRGGTVKNSEITVNYGGKYNNLETPITNKGYTFLGWYTQENGKGSHITSSTTVTATTDHILYANYSYTPPKEPDLKIALSSSSSTGYKYIKEDEYIFTGSQIAASGMIIDPDNTITSVTIKWDQNDSSTTCELTNDREKFNSVFKDYTQYKRYDCGTHKFTSTGEKEIKITATYDGKSKVATYPINVTNEKCPNVDITTQGYNGYYNQKIYLNLNSENQIAIKLAKWYTNNSSGGFTYWETGNLDETNRTNQNTLDATLSERKYQIITYDVTHDENSKGTCNGSFKIDKEGPEIEVEMRKLGHSIANQYNYTEISNITYEDGKSYDGGTILFYVDRIEDNKSGVKLLTCTPSGADSARNSSSFSTYRNIVTKGTTTITCIGKDNLDNTTTVKKTIINNHTHVYGDSVQMDKTNVALDAIYDNYTIALSGASGTGNTQFTCGDTHYYSPSGYASHITCVYCGWTTRQLKTNKNKGSWWCPEETISLAKEAGKTLDYNLYGCKDYGLCN